MSEKGMKVKATVGDPTGQTDVFRSAGVPNIEDALEAVYDYVQGKAKEVDREIKRNRGIPPGGEPAKMLTVEEKALVILSRACGVVWTEVIGRINQYRQEQGRDLFPYGRIGYRNTVLTTYMPVVEAIQADVLESMEAWSPLTSGQQRIVWRAKMVEHYRHEIIEVNKKDDTFFATRQVPGMVGKQKAIKSLDTAMRAHLDFFDRLIVGDLKKYLKGPGEHLREQAEDRRADKIQEVYELFEGGEIDEVEKVLRLRELIHREENGKEEG